jgi:hypothetical protein
MKTGGNPLKATSGPSWGASPIPGPGATDMEMALVRRVICCLPSGAAGELPSLLLDVAGKGICSEPDAPDSPEVGPSAEGERGDEYFAGMAACCCWSAQDFGTD